MNLEKKVTKLGAVLFGSLIGFTQTIGFAQTNDYSQKAESAQLGNEEVTFIEVEGMYVEPADRGTGKLVDISYKQNLLVVKKPNGKKIVYLDLFGDDLKLEIVIVEENGKMEAYDGKFILGIFQGDFDNYLSKLKEELGKEVEIK